MKPLILKQSLWDLKRALRGFSLLCQILKQSLWDLKRFSLTKTVLIANILKQSLWDLKPIMPKITDRQIANFEAVPMGFETQ